ncbi:hypothetical protein DFH27DRAFT_343528 [Peziza echinospora]|nr:hypothetical protein DFH27DRAFT_343528 [Peziza echinospora]
MASAAYSNGTAAATDVPAIRHNRFTSIPTSIDIPIQEGEDEEETSVEISLNALPDDPTELCVLLDNESSTRTFWMYIALGYAKDGRIDQAIEMLSKGKEASAMQRDANERLPMLGVLVWLYLMKARAASRNGGDGGSEQKTKDYYLNLATSTLNEAIRIDRDWTPNTLARGTISLMKSALATNPTEKKTNMDFATKIFDDAYRGPHGRKNMFAAMARARILFANKKYAQALDGYQEVLLYRPDMDPDPRIGIGLCFWALGYKDDAKIAWERALEIDPNSKVVNILLALYHLSTTTHLSESSPEFAENYRRAINEYTQRAYKLDKDFPMACTTFAAYFFSRKGMGNVETLAKKAIEYTDVNTVASDGWYLLARKHHFAGEFERALLFYRKSNEARFEKPRGAAGEERGFLPARLGIGQTQILMKDLGSAKFTFEKILTHYPKCIEAMTILGTLYAEEVFVQGAQTGITGAKDEVGATHRKAIHLLESVRNCWKDPKRNLRPDSSLLLTLAKLYEGEQQDKALQCLELVRQLEQEAIAEDDSEEEQHLPPQLLNNIAVLQYHQGNYDVARELYQTALTTAAVLAQKNVEGIDSDALVTSLSYNLARVEEAAGNQDEAIKLYEGLLARHEDYVDANMRLAYIYLRKSPEEGVKRVQKLMQNDGNNLEVRALYGWYLSRQKKKLPINIAEDAEMRHHKHSLQHYDKHDRYALTAMGNIYLITAREMKRDSDQDREKRRKMYEKAVEFFDKALLLDSKNAYAAQGVAIALVEDRRQYSQAVGIFTKIKETIKEGGVYLNLGHCLAGLEQWSRSIEAYDTALNKFQGGKDHNTLTCLGRVWFSKGRKEKSVDSTAAQSIESFKNALSYAKRALELAPDQVVYQFNVAFVQFQIAQTIRPLPENQRSLADMEAAAAGLDEAIKTFTAVARSKNPPYPPQDIDQRAAMGRNSLRGQLERAIESQKVYEEANASKLAEARRRREAELKKKEEEEARKREAEEERQRKLAEDRRRLVEEARERAKRKEEEELARGYNSAGGGSEDEKGKRKRKSGGGGGGGGRGRGGKKSRRDDGVIETSESERDYAEGGDSSQRPRARKRRSKSRTAAEDGDEGAVTGGDRPAKKRKRLTKGGGGAVASQSSRKNSSKYKSAEMVDSDDDSDEPMPPAEEDEGATKKGKLARRGKKAVYDEDDEDSPLEDLDADLFGDEDEAALKNAGKGVPIDPALKDADVEMKDDADED